MKKILITGSNGFIGRNLVELLESKYSILNPKKEDLDLSDEIQVCKFFKENDIEVVIHCAAAGVTRNLKSVSQHFETNLKIFFNIIKNKKYFKKMINLGSGAEYNKEFEISNVKENSFGKSIPKDSYGFYKYICSQIIQQSQYEIVNLRLFGVFGKYEDPNTRFISNMMMKILLNEQLIINQNAIFNYIHVKDLSKIIEFFIENKTKYKTYNVGSENNIQLIDLLKRIINISEKSDMQFITKNAGFNKEYTCNIDRLKSEMDLETKDLNLRLKELYEYYKKNINQSR
jgi:UDP-glucose 4-epimerase